MAMANMNLIGVFVTKLWPVQALACGGGGDGGGDGGATKTIISPKFSNFGDIITKITKINTLFLAHKNQILVTMGLACSCLNNYASHAVPILR